MEQIYRHDECYERTYLVVVNLSHKADMNPFSNISNFAKTDENHNLFSPKIYTMFSCIIESDVYYNIIITTICKAINTWREDITLGTTNRK